MGECANGERQQGESREAGRDVTREAGREAQKAPLGVVLNVPFAAAPCPALPDLRPGVPLRDREAYLDVLEREVEGAADLFEGRTIAYLAVRGNAALVPTDRLARLVRRLRRDVGTVPHAEVSLCMTPDTVCSPSLTSLAGCRFARLRLRVAAADPASLKALGAGWTCETVGQAARFVELFHVARPSYELVCGAPGVTAQGLGASVDALTQSGQTQEVAFVTPQGAAPAGEDEEACAPAADLLRARGFLAVAPGRYARPGGHDRALEADASGVERAVFGLGAVSRVDGYLTRNTDDLAAYLASDGDFTRLVVSAQELA
jgi:coproporphyrinogen III oxidase-like Fe-S oxidoreductase